ncbi:hypothetical protein LEMLEM_LOCUS5337 [Lemmus lemmus]
MKAQSVYKPTLHREFQVQDTFHGPGILLVPETTPTMKANWFCVLPGLVLRGQRWSQGVTQPSQKSPSFSPPPHPR